MNRKIYCPCDSDFHKHFQQQAGTGFSDITVFRGQPYQRGYGIRSFIARYGVPILKFLGKQLVRTGVDVGTDFLDGNTIKESLKRRGKEGLRNTASIGISKLKNLVEQSGSGIRKRKKKTNSKSVKRRKKDIFS